MGRKFLSTRRISTLLLGAVVFSGCIFKPEFTRPEVIKETSYRDESPSPDTIADLKWWEVFNDPKLEKLISTALNENRNLLVALARIDQARGLLGVARPDQFPQVQAQGLALRADTYLVSDVQFPPQNDFALFAPLSFEVDLWGKYASATEAQRAELIASDQGYRAATLSLVAEVASTYLRLLNLDRQLEISQRTVKNRRSYTVIIKERWKGGYTNKLDFDQAQIQEKEAEATVIFFQRQVRQTENAMSVLLGHTPHAIERSGPKTNPISLKKIPAGTPAMLLERRPDVRAAEESARAALMRVGVARSMQYPGIGLSGLIGLNSGDVSTLFSADGRVWSVGGAFLGPLIDLGKSWSRTTAAEAEAEQALRSYEQVVLQAVREVEDAMIAIRTYDAENKVRTEQVTAASSGDMLSRARYDNGIASFLEVLNTQTSLFESQLSQSASEQLYLTSIIQLYKALGGGWQRKEGDVKLPAKGWEFYQ